MEREKLIEAARLLKENCKAGCRAFNGYKCPFSNDDWDEDINPQDACKLCNYPHNWVLPEVQNDEHGQKY